MWRAEPEETGKASQGGTVLEADSRGGVLVVVAEGALRLHWGQLEGEEEVSGGSFAASRGVEKGEVLV